jgi:hypothetical protein
MINAAGVFVPAELPPPLQAKMDAARGGSDGGSESTRTTCRTRWVVEPNRCRSAVSARDPTHDAESTDDDDTRTDDATSVQADDICSCSVSRTVRIRESVDARSADDAECIRSFDGRSVSTTSRVDARVLEYTADAV